jgi:protoheme IX farnesyltransferase
MVDIMLRLKCQIEPVPAIHTPKIKAMRFQRWLDEAFRWRKEGDFSLVGRVESQTRTKMRPASWIALLKPRVMSLVVFTALVGMLLAPRRLDWHTALVAILCIAAGAGAASALNMWWDADVDALMRRTAHRPIPRGEVSSSQALDLGLLLAAASVVVLGFAVNIAAAVLLAFTIFFYAVVYTMVLKRSTPQNIVIGGAAGAFPPVIGWLAAGGNFALEPLLLFLIIFLWTPPHFWSLALNRTNEYAKAGIPMLPVVAGRTETKRQILLYSLLLVVASMLPWALGTAGTLYGASMAIFNAMLIAMTVRLFKKDIGDGNRAARVLFAFSIIYLFALFGMLLCDAKLV